MTKKNKCRLLYALFTIVAIIILFLISPFTLTKIADRSNPYYPTSKLLSEIREDTKGLSAEEIRNYSVKKTAKILSFTVKNNLPKGEANCIGYAQMCASISNYAFRANNINASAKPVVGYVLFCGVNLCNILKWCMPTKRWENFVKDHDFVEYHIDGQTIYCDASAYDLIYKDCKTVK